MNKIKKIIPFLSVLIIIGMVMNFGTENESEIFLSELEASNKEVVLTETEIYISKINNLQPAHADWASYYNSFSEMYEAADLIITGKVQTISPERRDNLIFTQHNIEVKKVFKGTKHKYIDVLVTGGELEGMITAPIEGADLLSTLNDYVLFLETTPEGYYLILGGVQGYGKVKDGQFVLKYMNSDQLRTIEELEKHKKK